MIRLENVCKSYGTRFGQRQVLDHLSFGLERGRHMGILGRNGAGKSTLIRLLSGAERPTTGRIDRGMSVSWPLAFTGAFQTHLTGLDNLKFICRIYGKDWKPLVPFVEEFTELGIYLREPLQSGNLVLERGLPLNRDGSLGSGQSAPDQIARLSRVVVSLQQGAASHRFEHLRKKLLKLVGPLGAAAGALIGRQVPLTGFESTHFKDFVWRAMFAKSLSVEDFDAVTQREFRVMRRAR